MQLTDKIFKGLYRRGVMLEQMKEPALSRTVKQMEPAEPCENPRDIDALSPEEILRAAEEADIVDETDGRPLAEKLREAMGSGTMLLIDAIDDEPYVSSQMGLMLALRDQCAGGIRLAAGLWAPPMPRCWSIGTSATARWPFPAISAASPSRGWAANTPPSARWRKSWLSDTAERAAGCCVGPAP